MELNRVQKKSIIPNEKGILSRHGRGFHFSSEFARRNLYYLTWSDEYVCDSSYRVDRDILDCYLLMNVLSGKVTVDYEDKRFSLTDSHMVLLDLRKHHMYKAETVTRMQQYMLHGAALPAYYRLLTENNGPVFHKDSRIQYLLNSLKRETMVPVPNDHTISMLITTMLCSLTGSLNLVDDNPVRQAKYFINDHYNEEISLDDIAGSVSLSKYYFSRLFEKETGQTPWDFLVETRLRNAMQMLTHSNASVEEIGISCGFSNTAHFIRSFKRHTNYTPGAFRKHFSDVPMGFMFGAD